MDFYNLPFGHTEWHVDRRDPRPVGQRPFREADLWNGSAEAARLLRLRKAESR